MLLFYLISGLFFISIPAQANNKTSLQNRDKPGKIDSLIRTFADRRLFNGSVLVAEKGKIIYKRGFGQANMEWNIPNQTDTKFRIGSVTKQFTAVLVLQLNAAGKLDLQGKISDYLPWYRKDNGNRITIHQLLTHTSGIPNYTADADAMNDIATHNYTPREIAEKHCSGALEFEPGTKFKYNNSGYFLLGVIIETLTKKSYAENLRENVFAPLGMKNSGIDNPNVLLQNRANGYEFGFEGFENTDFINMESATYAAGAIYSTVEDLYLWQTALDGGKILSKENRRLMLTPNLGNYGYGVYISKSKVAGNSKAATAIGHSGGINGFSALLIKFVEEETIVILLDNTRVGRRGNLENISAGIQAIVNDLPPPKIRQSIGVALSEKFKTASGEDLAAFYRRAKRTADYDFTGAEAFLNNLGYFLLQKGRVKDSIALLKLAVEEFPQSANTFDTLAEAFLKDGQKELAVKNYRRSLELNPQNTNAARQIRILQAQP